MPTCQASNIGVSKQEMVYSSLTRLLRKLHNYGTTERKSGSGRPRSVRTAVNISIIAVMFLLLGSVATD